MRRRRLTGRVAAHRGFTGRHKTNRRPPLRKPPFFSVSRTPSPETPEKNTASPRGKAADKPEPRQTPRFFRFPLGVKYNNYLFDSFVWAADNKTAQTKVFCEHCEDEKLVAAEMSEDAHAAAPVAETDIVIPAAHSLTHVTAVAATFETEGNKEYWVCSIWEWLMRIVRTIMKMFRIGDDGRIC